MLSACRDLFPRKNWTHTVKIKEPARFSSFLWMLHSRLLEDTRYTFLKDEIFTVGVRTDAFRCSVFVETWLFNRHVENADFNSQPTSAAISDNHTRNSLIKLSLIQGSFLSLCYMSYPLRFPSDVCKCNRTAANISAVQSSTPENKDPSYSLQSIQTNIMCYFSLKKYPPVKRFLKLCARSVSRSSGC